MLIYGTGFLLCQISENLLIFHCHCFDCENQDLLSQIFSKIVPNSYSGFSELYKWCNQFHNRFFLALQKIKQKSRIQVWAPSFTRNLMLLGENIVLHVLYQQPKPQASPLSRLESELCQSWLVGYKFVIIKEIENTSLRFPSKLKN